MNVFGDMWQEKTGEGGNVWPVAVAPSWTLTCIYSVSYRFNRLFFRSNLATINISNIAFKSSWITWFTVTNQCNWLLFRRVTPTEMPINSINLIELNWIELNWIPCYVTVINRIDRINCRYFITNQFAW